MRFDPLRTVHRESGHLSACRVIISTPQHELLLAHRSVPTVPEGHKHRVTTPKKPWKIQRRGPQSPRRDPRRELSERPPKNLGETPTEPSERQISSESLREGCAPRMVTLRNFRISAGHTLQLSASAWHCDRYFMTAAKSEVADCPATSDFGSFITPAPDVGYIFEMHVHLRQQH